MLSSVNYMKLAHSPIAIFFHGAILSVLKWLSNTLVFLFFLFLRAQNSYHLFIFEQNIIHLFHKEGFLVIYEADFLTNLFIEEGSIKRPY